MSRHNCFVKYKYGFDAIESSIICQVDSDIMNGISSLAIERSIHKTIRYYNSNVYNEDHIMITDITILGVYND